MGCRTAEVHGEVRTVKRGWDSGVEPAAWESSRAFARPGRVKDPSPHNQSPHTINLPTQSISPHNQSPHTINLPTQSISLTLNHEQHQASAAKLFSGLA